jgi:hypothetical protein
MLALATRAMSLGLWDSDLLREGHVRYALLEKPLHPTFVFQMKGAGNGKSKKIET